MRTKGATDRVDVVVIGSGPAGYVAGIHAAQLGLSVVVVEKDPFFGGTCLHRGCIPTKALLETAHLLDKFRKAKNFGIRASAVELDFAAVQKSKARTVRTNAKGIEYLFKKYGVVVRRGWGTLVGDMRVRVASDSGDDVLLTAEHGIILATGSSCKHLPFIEMDHERTIDSDDILEIEEVPKSLIVLGAGAVGTEFASIFQRFGSDVILVELLEHVLPLEDNDISKVVERSLKRQGIRVLTGTRVESVRRLKRGVRVMAKLADGTSEELSASKLLVATGRQPRTESIGLENTRIRIDKAGFIPVDETMQTAEPGVYAVGDVVATPMLAHLGSHEAILAVDHIAGRDVHPIDLDRVPNCTYCDPEVASVGLTEAEAVARGYDVKTATFPFTASSKAKILGEAEGMVKLVSEKKFDEVLGVHIVGPKATELIAEGVLALNLEATAAEIMHSIHPHPTLSEAVGEAGHALVFGQPIHT